VKIWSNALSIESVSTNVPLIIATPRTIASAVRTVRSLRVRSPLSANFVMRMPGKPCFPREPPSLALDIP
jgi:hypothetical protein